MAPCGPRERERERPSSSQFKCICICIYIGPASDQHGRATKLPPRDQPAPARAGFLGNNVVNKPRPPSTVRRAPCAVRHHPLARPFFHTYPFYFASALSGRREPRNHRGGRHCEPTDSRERIRNSTNLIGAVVVLDGSTCIRAQYLSSENFYGAFSLGTARDPPSPRFFLRVPRGRTRPAASSVKSLTDLSRWRVWSISKASLRFSARRFLSYRPRRANFVIGELLASYLRATSTFNTRFVLLISSNFSPSLSGPLLPFFPSPAPASVPVTALGKAPVSRIVSEGG